MRRNTKCHFVSYILENLAAVGVIVLIAASLGLNGRWLGVPDGSMLAQISGSSLLPVSFGVELTEASCVSGVTMAKYHFTINPSVGGFIELHSNANTSDIIDVANGKGFDRYLDTSVLYSWAGTPKSGYEGTNMDTLSVTDICVHEQNIITDTTVITAEATTLSTTPTASTNTSATSLTEISFSTQPGPFASCQTGSPLTPVFFLATKLEGGSFRVSSDSGMNNAYLEWGEHYLSNGKYSWTVEVKAGYVGVGAQSGSFELNNPCPVPSLTTTDSISGTSTGVTGTTLQPITSQTTPVVAIATSLTPQIRLFVDNKPVTAISSFDTQLLEIRIITTLSTKVSVSTIDGFGVTKVIGLAVKDDLLSKEGIDVWTFMFDTKKALSGVYKFYATVVGRDGNEIRSERTGIEVRHPVVKNSSTVIDPSEMQSSSVPNSSLMNVSQAEQQLVAERIADPASCTNDEECRIYCNERTYSGNGCLAYVQQKSDEPLLSSSSLTDGILPVRIAQMLGDAKKRPLDIPDFIRTADEFRQYCGVLSNLEICSSALVKNDMSVPAMLLERKEAIIQLQNSEKRIFSERIGARAFIDSDEDGVTDYDEVNIYKTNPNVGDTDGDGFLDGVEILARTNPRGGEQTPVPTPIYLGDASTTEGEMITSDETVRLENPIIAGVVTPSLLEISNVSVAELGNNELGSTTIKKLKFEGHAIPNVFVTLYIFSDPIVVTIKTDESGAWTYTLDKELGDGTHQVYSAITDSGGHILAKSNPLPFVKEASAISLGSAQSIAETPTVGFFGGASLYAIIAMLIGVLGVSLSLIGFIVRQKEANKELPGV